VRAHAPPATVRQQQATTVGSSCCWGNNISVGVASCCCLLLLLVAVACKGTSLLSAMSAGEPSVYTQIYTLICCKRKLSCCKSANRWLLLQLAINKVLYYAHSHLAAHPTTTATSAPHCFPISQYVLQLATLLQQQQQQQQQLSLTVLRNWFLPLRTFMIFNHVQF